MPAQLALKNKSDGLLFYLLLATSFFLLLEVSFFLQTIKAYLSDFSFVSSKLAIPLTILPGIIYFVIAELIIHLLFCLSIFILTHLIADLLNIAVEKKLFLGISLWLLGLITILIVNQVWYPNSKFAELSSLFFFNQTIERIAYVISLLVWFGIISLAAFQLLRITSTKLLLGIFALLGLGLSWLMISKPVTYLSAATAERPNVILVGIDSLRPDFLGYFGREIHTPFFDDFLNQATVFAEAVTPLARTFPSWTAILSGQYPKQTGVRFNLASQDKLNLYDALPAILQRRGYETIYASDETRFSNISKKFYFEKIITPPMGLNDFLIGTFNDFPISNLLINTSLGKWLFPYSYGNRPVFFSYEPNSFLQLVQPSLKKGHVKPIFLAIHFCLPHYPYLWASLSGVYTTPWERYVASIERVDQQIADLFHLLRANHLLDHAIVVLLSDHGEALELAGDRITEKSLFLPAGQKPPRFYPPSQDDETVNQSGGHGTDVLGLPQYHSLLAFRLYGIKKNQPNLVAGAVSLLDIKPTILELMHLSGPRSSGVSLANVILKKDKLPFHANIFLESDFSTEAIRTVYPDTRKVLLEGIQLFRIDPVSTHLIIKDKMGQMIIHSKQYADIHGEWMLALYKQNSHKMMPILINLKTGLWTNNLQSSFAKQSPVEKMYKALQLFYQADLD